MNLDSPEQGPSFIYAFQAAVKRTRLEFDKTASGLPQDLLKLFVKYVEAVYLLRWAGSPIPRIKHAKA